MKRLAWLLHATPPSVATILARTLEADTKPIPLRTVGAWTGLSCLVGAKVDAARIVAQFEHYDRDETLFKLARIAAVIANSPQGISGADARSWTHDLLASRQDSTSELEAYISRAAAKLGNQTVIAHAHVLFCLQMLAIVKGKPGGEVPRDGMLAFLMLASNDHIPEWVADDGGSLTDVEDAVATMFFCGIFNRNEDTLAIIVRMIEIMRQAPAEIRPSFPWSQIEHDAFGTTFAEYLEAFLLPVFALAKRWGTSDPPVLTTGIWEQDPKTAALSRRWFEEASVTIEEAASTYGTRPLPSGLYGIPAVFFRKPFVRVGTTLVGVSPWHVRDLLVLGTWGKLNTVCKAGLGGRGNQVFTAEWGFMFERWAGALAREACETAHATERVLLPERPGSHEEIEDIIFLDGNVVVLLSAKASVVPESSVKEASSPADVLAWLTRFFFEAPDDARKKGHRGGAAYLLDKKISLIRQGAFEASGIPRDATIVPCIVSYDNIGESPLLYRWIEATCRIRGLLLKDASVRPLTLVEAKNYEALVGLRAQGRGVCELLLEKTSAERRLMPLDAFLLGKVVDSTTLRLPSMKRRYDAVLQSLLTRLDAIRDSVVSQVPSSD